MKMKLLAQTIGLFIILAAGSANAQVYTQNLKTEFNDAGSSMITGNDYGYIVNFTADGDVYIPNDDANKNNLLMSLLYAKGGCGIAPVPAAILKFSINPKGDDKVVLRWATTSE